MNHLIKLHFRRFELKYLLNLSQYHLLKAEIIKHLKPDPFTGKKKSYIVNSLYFDTPQLSAYLQTEAGLKNRVKYRLRAYNVSPVQSPTSFLEIKRKQDMTVIKDRSQLSAHVKASLLSADLTNHPDPTIRRFLFAQRNYFLQPKVLVRYHREPFIGQDSELRVTFDSQIQVAPVEPTNLIGRTHRQLLPQHAVMEFKFTGSLPFWLGELVRRYSLERQPLSKYMLSIQATKYYLPWVTIS